MKIMIGIGTRPEAIKMAPVVKELQKRKEFTPIVCLTAQQREMVDQVLNIFGIVPDIDLNLMKPDQSLSGLTSSIITEMDRIIKSVKPEWVLIQGDTTTVMATALAAFYNHVKVGHVEAGLRSFNKLAPFPEEVNRKIAGAIADLHFCPTQRALQNLLKEGFPENACFITGNTVIDALHTAAKFPFNIGISELRNVPFNTKTIITITAHRRENFGVPLENICKALLQIAEEYIDTVHIVYPVHLNPNVQKPVYSLLGNKKNISLLAPLDYLSMINLIKQSKILLTDSGGLQEEAPGFGVPVLILRDITERPEGIESGNCKLVGSDMKSIINQVSILLNNDYEWKKMSKAINPYGDGKASQRIIDILFNNF